jgi:hypothetical protein
MFIGWAVEVRGDFVALGEELFQLLWNFPGMFQELEGEKWQNYMYFLLDIKTRISFVTWYVTKQMHG